MSLEPHYKDVVDKINVKSSDATTFSKSQGQIMSDIEKHTRSVLRSFSDRRNCVAHAASQRNAYQQRLDRNGRDYEAFVAYKTFSAILHWT